MYSLRLSTRMTTVEVDAIRTWSCRRPPGFRHRQRNAQSALVAIWREKTPANVRENSKKLSTRRALDCIARFHYTVCMFIDFDLRRHTIFSISMHSLLPTYVFRRSKTRLRLDRKQNTFLSRIEFKYRPSTLRLHTHAGRVERTPTLSSLFTERRLTFYFSLSDNARCIFLLTSFSVFSPTPSDSRFPFHIPTHSTSHGHKQPLGRTLRRTNDDMKVNYRT